MEDNEKLDVENKTTSKAPAKSRAKAKGKKAYDKPRVVYHAPLEAMASVCTPGAGGKASGTCTIGNS